MGFLKPILAVAFVAWLCYRIVVFSRLLRIMGLGVPVFSHAPGPCKIFHVNGSEDIDVLPNGLAIISSGLRYDIGPDCDPAMLTREGNLYAFDYNKPDQGLKELVLGNFDKSDFVPHGIDFYTDPVTGETSLFVVNHGGGKESIEIFQFDQETLALNHRRTVTDETIYFPNDVVAVGPDSFYVTNDHYFDNYLLKQVEIFYPLSKGNVVFYNGTHSNIAASELLMSNGINVDKTGKYVFVVSVLGGEILVYKRKDDNSLEIQQVISVGTMLDNVFVDENGNIWSGGTSVSIVAYSQNFSKPCTARVLQVKLNREDNGNVLPFKVDDIVEAYSTKGDSELKAASSAAYYKGGCRRKASDKKARLVKLRRSEVISVGTALDNAFVDENGNIWTGGTSICLLEYSKNFSKPCSARVLQVKLSREENGNVPFKVDDIVEAYSTKGDGELKAASSAAYYKGKLLIGTVFSNLMYCEVVAL